jgi:DNA polymerase I
LQLVTIDYLEVNRKPHLVIFNRKDKQRERIVVSDFQPYFYVPYLGSNTGSPLSKVYKTISGEDVVKVFTPTPEDVLQARKMYEKTFEADVHFTTRYLIDCIPSIEKSDLRIQYTDIEKDPKSNQITAISVYDTYLSKCMAFTWRADLQPSRVDKEYSFPSGYTFKAEIHLHNSRVNMLSDYIRFVKDTDPDILTGWYFIKYDAKELIQEINSVGLKAGGLSPINRAYVIGNEVGRFDQNIAIKGRVLWDMLKAYKFLQPSRLPDSSLEAIAQKELGEGKVKRTMNFTEMWLKDIEHLIEYNCKDSVLVYRIDQKKKILDYFDELRRYVGCEWDSLFYETLLWDVYILRKMHNKLALPTKIKIKVEGFKGADVFQPSSKGIHKNIILIDMKSLYPSIIITFNMSPETLVKGRPANPETDYILPNGIAFLKEPRGLLPTILDRKSTRLNSSH